MIGTAFGQGRDGQQFLAADAGHGQYGIDLEHSLGESAGLVKGGHADVAQIVQHRAALDQDAPARSRADAAEVTQRNGNEQGAGAGNDQQHQGAVNPLLKAAQAEERRQHGHQQGQTAHRRSVPARQAGDEALGGSLAGRRVFHHFQNTGNGGFRKGSRDFHGQRAVKVDGPGMDLSAGGEAHGHGFAGQGRGVHLGFAFQHRAVQGNLFAGPDQNAAARSQFFGVHVACGPVVQQLVGRGGPGRQQGLDRTA